jgi:hypothetical protein
MAPKAASAAAEIISLPPTLISRVDAIRLGRELESISHFYEQQAHHHTKTELARPSAILEAIAEGNQLDLAQVKNRERLQGFLNDLKKDAPTIHMSFAAEPSSKFTAKLITWLRDEIHPLMLLDIGLQPSIAAGCIIRTESKYIDCSVRQNLVQSKPKLLELMQGSKHA